MFAYSGYAREIVYYLGWPFQPKRPPFKKILLFTTGRTGSNLLVSLLNSHPSIHCNSELLVRRVAFPKLYLKCRESYFKKDVYGFKLNTYNFGVQNTSDPLSFVADLYEHGYIVINIHRRNILRQAISRLYANHRKRFHDTKAHAPHDLPTMTVAPDRLLEEIRFFEDHRELEEKVLSQIPYIRLTYEDDLADEEQHQSTVDKITDYLALPRAPVHTYYIKTIPDDLSSVIENYSELIESIQKTEYTKFLED
jgi:LPS sulfotransferase NodH